MAYDSVSKVRLLQVQIEGACKHHFNREFILSLTIAGSSDSLAKELVEGRGFNASDSLYVKVMRRLKELSDKVSLSKAEILREKYRARNLIKHHRRGEPEIVEIDFEFESLLAINNSIENYLSLGEGRSPMMENFSEAYRIYRES